MDYLGWTLRTFVPFSSFGFLPTRRVPNYQDNPVVIIGCDTGMGNAMVHYLVNELQLRKVYAGCFTEEGERGLSLLRTVKTFRIDVRDVTSVHLAAQFIQDREPNGVFAVVNIAGAM